MPLAEKLKEITSPVRQPQQASRMAELQFSNTSKQEVKIPPMN